MREVLPTLVFTAALAAVMVGCAGLASRVRRRGLAGAAIRAAMAAYDEAFHVSGRDSYYEIQAQADRKIPIPSPGDPGRLNAGMAPNGAGPPPRTHMS